MDRKRVYFYLILAFVAGGVIAYFLIPRKSQVADLLANDFTIQRVKNPDYKLISPLLDAQYDTGKESTEVFPYEQKMHTDLVKVAAANPQIHVSVYYDDLTNPSWIGVNKNDKYNAASLLKLPMLMAYLNLASDNPSILNTKISFTGFDENAARNIQSSQTINPNQAYTVEQLLEYMIKYSDDNAYQALDAYQPNAVKDVFSDVNAFLPGTDQDLADTDFITPEQYAVFFQILYDGSYLNWANSEKALELLTQVEFKDGLQKDLPSTLTVAHKFGERAFLDTTTNKITGYEFHDCGIIYNPNKPYLLCVMTKGPNLTDLENKVAEVSQTVYEDVNKQ